MDAAPPPAPPHPAPAHPTWPRSAQLAAAVLLGAALTLLGVHAWGHAGWGSRPTELNPRRADRAEPTRMPGVGGASAADPVPTSKGTGQKAAGLSGVIDVNTAGAAELRQLPGVGPKLSQAIIDERERAPFKSVDDLRRVRGIGAKTLDRLRPYVTAGRESARVVSKD